VKRIRELDEGDRTLKMVEEAQDAVTRERNQRLQAEQLAWEKRIKADLKR
jgi:FtsZ-binding cell division protein ZapB